VRLESADRARSNAGKPLRVLTAVGPGDVVTAYQDWKNAVRTVTETSITFSSQEFGFFEKHRIAFWAISSFAQPAFLADGGCRIENRPRAVRKPVSGVAFHAVQIAYAASLLVSAVRFRATHAIIDSGTTHWFALWAFRLFGIQVIPNFHNVYWPDGYEPRGTVQRAVRWLDGIFFRHGVTRALGVSPQCGKQLALMAGAAAGDGPQFFDYRAQFVRGDFGALPRPALSQPMRIMFAGRVEENKGVFDILTVSEILTAKFPGQFAFDICGAGTASAQLADEIAKRGASIDVTTHGKLTRPDLLAVYGASHLVIVPTRSTFCEGLPVCAEATIAGRPVITSRLSNALDAMRGALIEAREDDPQDYAEKIAALAARPQEYARLVAHTDAVSAQFTNADVGLAAVLARCLLARNA
jgi:glycogen synthase